jgi:hypothetical protein
MKFCHAASSILILLCLFTSVGCDTLGIPSLSTYGTVPDDVKAQPRLVQTPDPVMHDASGWPRVGDVPFAPKDFSPPAAYNHYMSEMEFERDEAGDAKKQAADEDATIGADLISTGDAPRNLLVPPQLPKE